VAQNKSATFASYTALLLFTLTLIGLIWSRAILSVVHILWLVTACFYFIKNKHLVAKNPLIIWSVVPLLLFLFGLYQQPLAKRNLDYFLLISMYPIAVLGINFLLKNASIKTCLTFWVIAAFISILLPLVSYLQNFSGIYLMYAQAKTLPVWMDADHVRYGIFLCSALLFLLSCKFLRPNLRYTLLIFIILMIVLLSSRTAWVGAAIIIIIIGWQKIRQSRYAKFAWLIPLLLLLFSLGAYKFIDSVKGKVDYMIYDWQSFDAKKYDANFSDGVRRSINYTALKIVTTENKANAGWAAISPTLKNSFQTYFPSQKTEYGWPFNQWLYWWMGAGWWTAILFSAWLFYPVICGWRRKNYALISWTLLIVASCFVESTLSLQFGVFLHAWVTALLWSISEYDNS
jgi:hypothetical protein